MMRCLVLVVSIQFTLTQTASADLLGYWSGNTTNGEGSVLTNDQGNGDLDGELVSVDYTSAGEGFTGGAGDYALRFPGEDGDYRSADRRWGAPVVPAPTPHSRLPIPASIL